MFTIRSRQLDSFAAAAAASFPQRMVEFLHREMPEVCDGETEGRVDRAIVRAHGQELLLDLDVARFVVLTFTHGPRFDEAPWADEILARRGTPASARIHQVYEAAIRRRLVEDTALEGKERP